MLIAVSTEPASWSVLQVAAGGTHSLALTSTGRMFTWGRGSYGRLGLNQEKDCYQPVECLLPGGHDRWRIAALTCGGRHSMCLAVPLRDGPASIPGAEEEEESQEANGSVGLNGGGGATVDVQPLQRGPGGAAAASPADEQSRQRPPSSNGRPPSRPGTGRQVRPDDVCRALLNIT